MASYGGDVSELVPGPVLSRLRSRLSSKLSLPEERDQAVPGRWKHKSSQNPADALLA